jgi:AraC family transcriptional regulator
LLFWAHLALIIVTRLGIAVETMILAGPSFSHFASDPRSRYVRIDILIRLSWERERKKASTLAAGQVRHCRDPRSCLPASGPGPAMTTPDRQYDSHADFLQVEYASVIRRITPLRLATLIEANQTPGDWSDKPTPDLVIGRIASGRRTFSVDIGAGRFGGSTAVNKTILTAPNTATSIQMAGEHILQVAALPYSRLKDIVGDDLRLPDDGDFGALHAGILANPLFGQMIGAMFDVPDFEDPAAQLYFDSSLLSLTAMLVMESGKPTLKPKHRGGLANWQIRRARDALSGAFGNFDLTALAQSVGLSPYHFARAFKQSTGLPPHRYQIMLRVERAQDLLANSTLPISDVAAAVGYDDQGQLARLFRREVGATPSQYRRERRA